MVDRRCRWNGNRQAVDIGYLNTFSATREFEVRAYYNASYRNSALINSTGTLLQFQPRNYGTLGIEPRFTQRSSPGPLQHDVSVGYRYIRERGDDNSYNQTLANGVMGPTSTFDNATDAHAAYLDDRIAFGRWRLTPGVRFEHIESNRVDETLKQTYATTNPLQPELAKTFEVGARWTSKRIHAEVTAFNVLFDNQIIQLTGVVPATFQNIGATRHQGIETAIDYQFAEGSVLRGLDAYANFTYTKAIQKSGPTAGLDVPFYSRVTDTLGLRYETHGWTFNVSSTQQSSQYSELANTVAETPDARVGRVPGFRLWDAQVDWKIPGWKGSNLTLGMNNIADKRFYTRNVDGNPGRMVGAPRMVYLQGHFVY